MTTVPMIERPDPIAVGPIFMTNAIQEWIDKTPELFNEIHSSLLRYLSGDWGDIDPEDWPINVAVVKSELPSGRLMGAYELSNGEDLWIITDGYGRQDEGPDCCYTTILSPDEY